MDLFYSQVNDENIDVIMDKLIHIALIKEKIMVSYSDLVSAAEFKVNEEAARYITKRPIKAYRIEEIEIGKIHRFLDKKVFSLYKTDPYRYLTEKADPLVKAKYQKYCLRAKMDNSKRSEETFNELISTFGDNYDVMNGIIIVDQFNHIVDGQHRVCILLNKFGEKYKIKVLKLKFLDMGYKIYFRNAIYLIKKKMGLDC